MTTVAKYPILLWYCALESEIDEPPAMSVYDATMDTLVSHVFNAERRGLRKPVTSGDAWRALCVGKTLPRTSGVKNLVQGNS